MKIKFLIILFIAVGKSFATKGIKDIEEEAKRFVNGNWLNKKIKQKNFVLKLLNRDMEDCKPDIYNFKTAKNQSAISTRMFNGERINEMNCPNLCYNFCKWALFEIKTVNNEIYYLYCSDIESINNEKGEGLFSFEAVEDMRHFTDEEERKGYWEEKNKKTFLNIKVIVADTYNVSTMKGMFSGNRCLKTISGLTNFDTSNCTDFSYMFNGCSSLKSVDVQNFDVKKAAGFDFMFTECVFEELDLRNWEFTSMEAFKSLFCDKFCNSIIFKEFQNFPSLDSFMFQCVKFIRDTTFNETSFVKFIDSDVKKTPTNVDNPPSIQKEDSDSSCCEKCLNAC